MENVISFTFANWVTVCLMAGIALVAFLVVIKGGSVAMDKIAERKSQ